MRSAHGKVKQKHQQEKQRKRADAAKNKSRAARAARLTFAHRANLFAGHILGDIANERQLEFLVLISLVHHEDPEHKNQQRENRINR